MANDATTLEPVGLGDELKEVIPRLRQTLEQAEARETHLMSLIDTQRMEIRKIRRALTVFDPEYVHPNTRGPAKKKSASHRSGTSFVGQTRSNGTATGHGISMEACAPFVKQILKMTHGGKPNEFITQKDVYKVLDADQTKGSAAFRFLRSIEFLRKAGRDPNSRRERFAVVNPKAYDEALEIASKKGDN